MLPRWLSHPTTTADLDGVGRRAPAVAALVWALSALVLGACRVASPPTITPPAVMATSTGATSIEIPVQPPVGATLAPGMVAVPELSIGDLVTYRDAGGMFSLDIPAGWVESRQPPAEPGSYVIVGTVFQPPENNGYLSVTQFDSGRRPASVGTTANEVLGLTKVMELPGYLELGREKVIERPDEALRIEMTYTRRDGVPTHSLVLFQIDGTVFSMVNVGVEADGWLRNEAKVRDILATYRVPATSGG